jgi:hypothetical protein
VQIVPNSLSRGGNYRLSAAPRSIGQASRVVVSYAFLLYYKLMIKPEAVSNPRPAWTGDVISFFQAIEDGTIEQPKIAQEMIVLTFNLLRSGKLANCGILQKHLREKYSFIQLVAEPFDAINPPRPDLVCLDVVSGDPRGHSLAACVSEIDGAFMLQTLQSRSMSDEVNEATLTYDTGIIFKSA